MLNFIHLVNSFNSKLVKWSIKQYIDKKKPNKEQDEENISERNSKNDTLEFDVAKCIEYAKTVNPDIKVIPVSAVSGEGLDIWFAWIKSNIDGHSEARKVAGLGDS